MIKNNQNHPNPCIRSTHFYSDKQFCSKNKHGKYENKYKNIRKEKKRKKAKKNTLFFGY